ncbi:MAG: NAD(P)H-dependent oxidoreductase [Terracidiphilus sp.]
MPTLLHIDSSPRTASVSSKLAAAFVEKWTRQHPTGTVVHHNTSLENVPYLDEVAVDAMYTPAAELTAAQKRAIAYSDKLVDELLAADVVVLGVPMWNLGIPASLKAWIDLIVREGRTFAFAGEGATPLLPPGKKVVVFSARGGAFPEGTPSHAFDYQEPYLRTILGVIGLTEIEFIHAEHQSEGPEAAAEGLARAKHALAALGA